MQITQSGCQLWNFGMQATSPDDQILNQSVTNQNIQIQKKYKSDFKKYFSAMSCKEHNGYPAEHNGYPAEYNSYPGVTRSPIELWGQLIKLEPHTIGQIWI